LGNDLTHLWFYSSLPPSPKHKDDKNKDCITALNEDGKLYCWEWDFNAIDAPETTEGKKGTVKAVPSKSPKKAHDSVIACAYNPVKKELISLGSDK